MGTGLSPSLGRFVSAEPEADLLNGRYESEADVAVTRLQFRRT